MSDTSEQRTARDEEMEVFVLVQPNEDGIITVYGPYTERSEATDVYGYWKAEKDAHWVEMGRKAPDQDVHWSLAENIQQIPIDGEKP